MLSFPYRFINDTNIVLFPNIRCFLLHHVRFRSTPEAFISRDRFHDFTYCYHVGSVTTHIFSACLHLMSIPELGTYDHSSSMVKILNRYNKKINSPFSVPAVRRQLSREHPTKRLSSPPATGKSCPASPTNQRYDLHEIAREDQTPAIPAE